MHVLQRAMPSACHARNGKRGMLLPAQSAVEVPATASCHVFSPTSSPVLCLLLPSMCRSKIATNLKVFDRATCLSPLMFRCCSCFLPAARSPPTSRCLAAARTWWSRRSRSSRQVLLLLCG